MHNRIKYFLALWAALLIIPIVGYSQFFIYSGEQPIDLDIRFTRQTIESAAKQTFFNVLVIVNRANRSETFTLNYTVPDGWNVIGESKKEITLSPNDSIYVPVMIAIGSRVRGDIGYNVIASLTDTRGNTVKNEYCFVKIPRVTSLSVKLVDRSAFLDQRTGSASFTIKAENKGNREELVSFLYEADQELAVGPSRLSQYAAEMVVPSYSDTTISMSVMLKDIMRNGKNIYKLSIKSSNVDTTYTASMWFRKLDAKYKNYISETRKPLVVELNAQGLLQAEKAPSFALRAQGILLLPNHRDIYYYYRNFNSRDPEELYLYNRMYVGSHLGKWQFEVGDGFRSIEANLSGRGGYASYTTSKLKVDLVGTQNLRTYTYNIGSSQRYRFSKTFSVNSGIVYNQNDRQNINSSLALLGTDFSLGKSHQFYVMGAYNKLNQQIDGKPNHDEFGGEVKYTSKIGEWNTSVNAKYGTHYYFGNYRGRLYVNFQSAFPISNLRRIQINGYENWSEVPRITDGVSNLDRANKTRDFAGQYFEFINPRVMLNGGFGYEEVNWQGVSPLPERSFIHTMGFRVIAGARFKLNETNTFLSPQAIISKGKVNDFPYQILDIVPSVVNRRDYSYQYFSLNLRSPAWGFMASYTSGPKSIFEQYTYFFNARPNRRLRFMPYFDSFIYQDQLQLLANVSYSNDLVSRATYTNITTQLYWHLPKDWRVNFLMAYSMQRRVDGREASQTYQTIYIEAGIKKEFNWSHPRIGYHNVTFVFFKDFNGNGTQEPNEPGIKSVLVNLQRQLTPEIGFIPGDVTSIDLLSDELGRIYLDRIPSGLYSVGYNPVGGDAGSFSKAFGDVEINIDKNTTHFIPFVEKNKVFGKIVLNRSRLSGLGRIDLANVRITATDSQGRSYSTLTDKSGEFVLFAPVTDEYILTMNNIFYENFDLRQNNFLVQFNGYKQFEVNYVFDEKVRRINFAATDQELRTGVQQVRRTTISGTVKDANSQQAIRARVNLINIRTNAIVNSTNSSATSGDYTLNFMASDNYLLEILADDYWYMSENLVLQQVTTFMNINRDVLLRPISVGSKIELNIRFDVNEAVLVPESVAELNRVLRQVKSNPTVRLEIQGHCDDLEAIQKPTIGQERAGAVAKYLIENGFSNVEVKDMKNSAPATSSDSDEGRMRNRRIEVVVLRR